MVNINDIRIRDPYIYKEDGIYYLYGTYHLHELPYGFYAYKSKDLINFEGPYPLFIPRDKKYGDKIFWAPEMYKYNGKYYLFGTIYNDKKIRQTHVFVCDNPIGNFVPNSEKAITPEEWHCLDGNLFFDEDGTPYLTFCREWCEVKNGQMYVVRLTKDLKNRVGDPHLLFSAKDAKWCSPICGDGYVTDGPFVYKKDKRYYMLWSSYCEDNYSLSIISSSNNIKGPWIQEDIPYLHSDAGHGMLFEDNNKIYLALHTPNSQNERLKIILFDENANGYYIK